MKTLIKDITVIPMDQEQQLPHRDVLIDNNSIESITISGSNNLFDGHLINGTGKFLLPGFWDNHAHVHNGEYFPLFLMNGITSVRDTGSDSDIFELRRQIESDKILGPNLYICGPILEGNPSFWGDTFRIIKTEDEAAKTVKELKEKGADFIKVYHTLQTNLYKVVLKESAKLGMRVTGHIPITLSPVEALELGQNGIEHINSIMWDNSVGEIIMKNTDLADYDDWYEFTGFKINKEKLNKLLKQLKKHRSFYCPTLIQQDRFSAIEFYQTLTSNPINKYIERTLVQESWNPNHKNADKTIKGLPALYFSNTGVVNNEAKKIIRQIADNCIILAGTDAPNPFVIPGFSLHDELELLYECGLSTYEVLKSATVNGAEFVNKLDKTGTVELGKTANLVILNANPIDDIRNSRTINAVILNGRYYDYNKLMSKVRIFR